MNSISRGIRNAFRNVIRTASITVILGLSIGLCLTMLVAQKAVTNKISSVKSSIGNTVSIAAAGTMGFQGGGNPLTETSIDKLTSIAHVTKLNASISDQLRNTSGSSRNGTAEEANTSLVSSIDAGSLGRRFGGSGSSTSTGSGVAPTTDGTAAPTTMPTFTPPVSAYGQTDTAALNGTNLTIKSGTTISGTTDKDVALVGTSLATKNNLKVGSTFMAYDSTITVAGIYDSGSTFSNNSVIFSLPTLQRLSSQTGDVTSASLTVDSISNIDSVVSTAKKSLGTTADVTSSKDTASTAIAPLDSVKTISTFSLIGAIVAGAIIILLTMVMVVRERKREIGVVKAIGGSNLRIIGEFMVESLTLALLGAIVGLLIGVIGGQPVTKLLVNNSTSSTTTTTTDGPGGAGGFGGRTPGGGGGFGRRAQNNAAVRSIKNIQTQIGWNILLEGFGAAVLIAALGSALAAGMISKVRPANVMRAE